MACMENLLDALEECGEASAFYKKDKILMANEHFAELFEKSPEECKDLPIMDICHVESMEMVDDYMKRRVHGDPDVPKVYSASFVKADDSRIKLEVNVLETKNTDGAFLAVVSKTGRD